MQRKLNSKEIPEKEKEENESKKIPFLQKRSSNKNINLNKNEQNSYWNTISLMNKIIDDLFKKERDKAFLGKNLVEINEKKQENLMEKISKNLDPFELLKDNVN